MSTQRHFKSGLFEIGKCNTEESEINQGKPELNEFQVELLQSQTNAFTS